MRKVIIILFTLSFLSCDKKEVITNLNIVPLPSEMTVNEGYFEVTAETPIYYTDTDLEKALQYAQTAISKTSGYNLNLRKEKSKKGGITYVVDESIGEKDTYHFNVDKNGITITASTARAAILGTQTLRQFMELNQGKESYYIPMVAIKDTPEHGWRGFMLDVARHFYSKEEVKEIIDILAYYKFNKFHWHLTDDQGWRIEIKKYPQLTLKSAYRQYNNHDRTCIKKAKAEHNTDFNLPEKFHITKNDTVLYGGYYTQNDIREVVNYAMERGIDVMPEVDMPGHFSAGIAAYPEISCFNSTGWGHTFSAPICPGKDITLEFCQNVLKEIFELFPYEYVDIGADEVEKDNWIKCPHCQQRMKDQNLKNEKELQSWFVKSMEQFIIDNGKKMMGWDEILEGGMSETATMRWWRSWVPSAPYQAVKQGNEVVLCPNTYLYFDYAQDDNTLKSLYEHAPVPKGLDEKQLSLIKGVQANLWAEYIPSYKRAQYLTFPRMIALSEITWRADSIRDWNEFYPRLISQFDYLDKLGINYRPLGLNGMFLTNAFVGETTVNWESPLSRVSIYYTTDGSVPDNTSTKYEEPFVIDEDTDFTIRLYRPDGTPADIIKTSYKKQEYISGVSTDNMKSGVKCYWHEAIFNTCYNIEKIPVKQEYTVEQLKVPAGVGGKRGVVFKGYINIDKQDIYTFSLGSDDGSQFFIGDELVVDNDGPHGPIVLEGQRALGVGAHPFRLYYFDMNNGGFIDLKMFDSSGNEIKLNNTNLRH